MVFVFGFVVAFTDADAFGAGFFFGESPGVELFAFNVLLLQVVYLFLSFLVLILVLVLCASYFVTAERLL